MAASMSLSYLSMRFTQLVVMIAGHLLRAPRRAERGRVRRLPAAGRRLLPPGREDQRGAGDLPQGDRRLQALHRAARHRAGHRRRAGRDRGRRACAATSATRTSPSATARSGRCCATSTSTIRAGRDGRLRRPLRRRARRRSARCCRASTRSTPAGSPSTASTSATMTLASLRREIGIVQQDVFLFAGTIRENIAYGRLDATEDEIEEAARRAQLDDDDRGPARRAGHGHRRARREALRRAEAAPRDRAHVPQEPADPDPGRGDLRARHRDGARHPAIAGRAGARAAPRWSSPTAWPRSSTPTASWWSTRSGVAEQGRHDELIAAGGIYRRLHTAQFGTLVV